MKKAYVYMNYDNIIVLETYLNVIKNGLEKKGYKCEKIWSLDGVPTKSLIVFSAATDVFRFYLKGYKNVLLWQQGIAGEESFMRNHSNIRKIILNFIDCYAMKKARGIFFVSSYMKKYYEKMACTDFSKKCYIMPCFNEQLDNSVFEKKDYSKKTFAYVGSLSVWQCFEETAELYSKIEKAIPNTFFKVLTFDVEKAERIINEKQIKNYCVKCVPKEDVQDELKDISFGFIIRRDTEVNRVATPTKLSSYLSVGVLPIYSSCLRDFHTQANGKSFALVTDIGENIDELISKISIGVDKLTVQQEIIDLFETYYSAENHSKNISFLSTVT